MLTFIPNATPYHPHHHDPGHTIPLLAWLMTLVLPLLLCFPLMHSSQKDPVKTQITSPLLRTFQAPHALPHLSSGKRQESQLWSAKPYVSWLSAALWPCFLSFASLFSLLQSHRLPYTVFPLLFSLPRMFFHFCRTHPLISFRNVPKDLPGPLTSQSPPPPKIHIPLS